MISHHNTSQIPQANSTFRHSSFLIPALLNILTMLPLSFDSETSLQTGFVAGTTVMLGRIIFISALFFFFFYNVFSESCVV